MPPSPSWSKDVHVAVFVLKAFYPFRVSVGYILKPFSCCSVLCASMLKKQRIGPTSCMLAPRASQCPRENQGPHGHPFCSVVDLKGELPPLKRQKKETLRWVSKFKHSFSRAMAWFRQILPRPFAESNTQLEPPFASVPGKTKRSSTVVIP